MRVNADASGNKIGEQGQYPYGESWYSSGTTTKWQFTNYERDSESGNDYAIARFYVNRLGRFYSPDPVDGNRAAPQTLDLYPYAADDPIDNTDPDGRVMTSGFSDGCNTGPGGTPPFFPGGGFPWPVWWPGGGGTVGPTPPWWPQDVEFDLQANPPIDFRYVTTTCDGKLVSSFSIWLPKKLGGEITRCRYSWTCANGDRYGALSGLKKINSDLGGNGTGPKFLTCPKTAQAVFTIAKANLNFWPFTEIKVGVAAIRFISAQ